MKRELYRYCLKKKCALQDKGVEAPEKGNEIPTTPYTPEQIELDVYIEIMLCIVCGRVTDEQVLHRIAYELASYRKWLGRYEQAQAKEGDLFRMGNGGYDYYSRRISNHKLYIQKFEAMVTYIETTYGVTMPTIED